MSFFRLLLVSWIAGATACNQAQVTNVNSRYTVESVELSPDREVELSPSLRADLDRLIGEKFNPEVLDNLAKRLRKELRARFVSPKVTRGTQPDTVKVIFHFERRGDHSDIVLPRLIYHSKQNWTLGVDGTWKREGHNLGFGILTDGDELIERYSGFRGSYERTGLVDDHLRLRFDFESWHEQWNPATQVALEQAPEVPGIYRTRFNFQPGATVVLCEPLTLSIGFSFQRLETQFPAARTEGAHAVRNTLRYRRRWEPSATLAHELEAGYSLRAATRALDSDFVYTRHYWDAKYTLSGAKESVIVSFAAGAIYGGAPLFERFVLGNSRTFRGWSKFDVDPLGGDRMAYGSLEYRYRGIRVVYDAGSGWRRGNTPKVRQSVGLGFIKDGITAVIAFPVREGPVEPIFMTGISF